MIRRWAVLLLIILNLAVAGWLLFRPHSLHTPPVTDPDVPTLELLSGQTAPPASTQQPKRVPAPSGKCLRLGPFETRNDLHQASEALQPEVAGLQSSRKDVTNTTGWRVYLPAVGNYDKAIAAARRLAAKGVNDYYVVTAGERENSVSLGLFRQEANAHQRLRHIRKLGFDPELAQRRHTVAQYWLQIALPAAAGFDWHEVVSQSDIDAHSTPCT